MSKSFQVLLIEDDKTLGSVLLKALKNAGVDAYLAHSPEAAQTLCSHCDFSVIVADCMLPRMDGVSLIQTLIPQLTSQPKILLMTGVFKDRGFLSEAKRKTGAKEILSKPFDVNEFLEMVMAFQEEASIEGSEKEKSIVEYFSEVHPDLSELMERFSVNRSLEGREIPFVLSLLLESNWTGALHIQTSTESSGVIYLESGGLIQVYLDDSKSLLGHLLMDLGFVEPDDLEIALASKEKTLIGQKLIKQLSISPHALELALCEQTVSRLSQLITPDLVQMRLSPNARAPKKNGPEVSLKRLHQLFNDWGESKYDSTFLQELFNPCLQQPVQQLSKNEKLNVNFDRYLASHSIGEVIESLLKREILPTFPSNHGEDIENLKQKYERLQHSLKSKNYFQVLGLSTKALTQEIEKAYLSLKNSMRSNLRTVTDSETLEICRKIDHRVERAYTVLIDDISRQKYLHQLQAEAQQALMVKEPEYELAIALLNSGKFRDAYESLKRISDQKYNFPDLVSYLIIAHAKCYGKPIVESELSKVSPENRQSGAYLMAKALALKAGRNYSMAIQYFRRSLVYNPSSQLAKKEIASCMRRMDRQLKAQGSLLGNFMGGILGNNSKKKAS